MRGQNRGMFRAAACFLLAFLLWTLAVRVVDVQPVGPLGSPVGFAAVNTAFHNLTGVHMFLYNITDWLSVIPLGIVLCFALVGAVQLVRRRSLWKVDGDILILGVFYAVVMGLYLLFEVLAVNYRPVLIEGVLEASYPSSTTMLVLCVMPTALMQLNSRVGDERYRKGAAVVIVLFTAFMVLGRVVSGVHWLTDIIGGALLSTGLVLLYATACGRLRRRP